MLPFEISSNLLNKSVKTVIVETQSLCFCSCIFELHNCRNSISFEQTMKGLIYFQCKLISDLDQILILRIKVAAAALVGVMSIKCQDKKQHLFSYFIMSHVRQNSK